MAKQHMARPCGWLLAADLGWAGTGTSSVSDTPWQHSSIHREPRDPLVPEQFVFLPFSNLHFCMLQQPAALGILLTEHSQDQKQTRYVPVEPKQRGAFRRWPEPPEWPSQLSSPNYSMILRV